MDTTVERAKWTMRSGTLVTQLADAGKCSSPYSSWGTAFSGGKGGGWEGVG